MEVDYIFFGWGWDGYVKKLEYSPGTIKSTPSPSIRSIGPNGIKGDEYRPLSVDYQVSEFLTDDGRTYLLAVAGDFPSKESINASIKNTTSPPKPFK